MHSDTQKETKIKDLGRELFTSSQASAPHLFDKNFWSGKMMDWSMENPDFKVQMFRFVDVFPALNSSEQIAQHIRAYFLDSGVEMSPLIKSAMGVISGGGLFSKLASAPIRKNITAMAKSFICGVDADDAQKNLERLWKKGYAHTVDILGEAVVSEKEAEHYFNKYMDLIQNLPRKAQNWTSKEELETASWGKVPRVNVSVKCSSLFSQISNLCFRDSVEGIKERLRLLMREAQKNEVFLYLDMENHDMREILLTVAEEIFFEEEFKSYPHLGIVVQAYLKNCCDDINRMENLAIKRGAPLHIRLVKGAYWDFENILASQRNWESPVFLNKVETDENYERCAEQLVKSYPHLVPAFASHNIRSLSHAIVTAEEAGLKHNDFEIQMLYGMSDAFRSAFQGKKFRIREYTPVGELLPGMAYLVRRLLENTSNEGFLKAKFADKESTERLLAKPVSKVEESSNAEDRSGPISREGRAFSSEAMLDFSKLSVRENFDSTQKKLVEELPMAVNPVVGLSLIHI